MDCLFCRIAKKEIPAELVYEDEYTVGVLDVNPRAPGHTMILPKKHAGTIFDLDGEEIGQVFGAVKKTAEILEKAFSPDGFTIGINHGRVAGQVIEHLHIHVIPRYKDDNGGSIHSVVKNPPKESLNEIKEKILKAK